MLVKILPSLLTVVSSDVGPRLMPGITLELVPLFPMKFPYLLPWELTMLVSWEFTLLLGVHAAGNAGLEIAVEIGHQIALEVWQINVGPAAIVDGNWNFSRAGAEVSSHASAGDSSRGNHIKVQLLLEWLTLILMISLGLMTL